MDNGNRKRKASGEVQEACRSAPACQPFRVKVTADDIAQLLASPPPRAVPAQVVTAARRGRGSWGTVVFGLFFGAFGMIFVWAFFPWRIWDEWRLAGSAVRTATGIVSGVTDARMKVNGRKVMEYHFTFTPEAGAGQTGDCFATAGLWTAGDSVTVRYLPGDPGLACIEGARLNATGWAGMFAIIFPGVGVAIIVWFVVQRRQTGRLLREGLTAEVDIRSVTATALRVNNQPVFKIVLAAPALNGGQPLTIMRRNLSDLELARERAERKLTLFVLYDPRKPRQMIFPEALIDA